MSSAISENYVNISSDGYVTTFTKDGVRITDLCGDLTILHAIIRINKLPSKEKSKLPSHMRLRNTVYNFTREDTQDIIPIPNQQIASFAKHIKEGYSEELVNGLLLQLLKEKEK